jgi:hypothetical protein
LQRKARSARSIADRQNHVIENVLYGPNAKRDWVSARSETPARRFAAAVTELLNEPVFVSRSG